MTDRKPTQIPANVRLRGELADRVEALVERARERSPSGEPVSASAVVRACIRWGLPFLEEDPARLLEDPPAAAKKKGRKA